MTSNYTRICHFAADVELDSVEYDDRLSDWIQRAVKFVSKLPAK